jgi:hypothetical protein
MRAHGSLAGLVSSVLVALSACVADARPDADGWAGSKDTLANGRVVVRNGAANLVAGRLEERVRLGSLDGEGPELFGSIEGVALGPEGEVYVLDGQVAELRVFDGGGAHQRTIGRQGEGPGELDRASGLAVDGSGTVWVLNWGNGRYSGFDPASGALVREVLRPIAFAALPWQGAFQDGERLVDVGLDLGGEIAVMRFDTAFVPVDTMPLPQPDVNDRVMLLRGQTLVAAVMEPFAPQPSWTPRPRGGVIFGDGEAYRLHRVGFEQDTSLTIELDRERVPVSAAERDSALAAFQEMTGRLGGARPERQPRVRSMRPAHGALFVDDQDRTWVQSVRTAGEEGAWDVFAADGRYLGRVPIPDPPTAVRPVVRAGRMVVATQVDGYPAVVVYEVVGLAR